MDLINSDILININGYIICEIKSLNNSIIYKIFTENFGLIDVYTKNTNTSLSIGSKYSINIIKSKDMYVLKDYELTLYNSFLSKDKILFINLINEIILKTSIQENPNKEIFLLIEEIIGNYELYDYKVILIYFVYKYLLFSGYHIIENLEDINNEANYYLDILNLEITNFKISNNYIYKINVIQKDFLIHLSTVKFLDLVLCSLDEYNLNRILGILINSLCINFTIKSLNTYKMINS